MSRTEWFYSRVAQPSISVISGISEGMFERGGLLPRELPERPEMARSTGYRVSGKPSGDGFGYF